jgi:hypothetical protein
LISKVTLERTVNDERQRKCRYCRQWWPRSNFRSARGCLGHVAAECKACLSDRRWAEIKARVISSPEPWIQLQREQMTRRRLSLKRSEMLHRQAANMGFTNSWDLCWRAPERIGEMFDAVHIGARYQENSESEQKETGT